ncbi:MAG: hypothetical protein Alpg2KO_24140 [Alphaproteobacteria bacterium]
MFDSKPTFPAPPTEASFRGRGIASTDRSRFRNDQCVIETGDSVTGQLEIMEGLVIISRDLPDGSRQIVDFLEAGDFIEPGAIGRHRITARAAGLVVVARHRGRTEDLAPHVMQQMLASANRQLSRQSDHVTTLGAGSADSRLALAMIRFAGSLRDTGELPISLPVSRQYLAEFAGLTTETVSRILSRWKAAGLVRAVTTRAFIIPDATAFDRLARAEA